MDVWRFVSSLSLPVLLFVGCRTSGDLASSNGEQTPGGGYTSIEGLWISTDETSWYAGPDTQRAVLHFQRDARGAMGAKGYFARNGDYQMKWELLDVQYEEGTRRISILDADRDTLIGFADSRNERITGSVHLLAGSVNPLSFVRSNDDRLAVRLLHARLPDADGNVTYTYRRPDQVDDGLTTSALPNGETRAAIGKVVERIINQEFGHIKALLVLQGGELVLEEYFFGYGRDELHRINSCTKSVASLLLGIALADHPNIDVKRPVFSFFPEYDSLKTPVNAAVSLAHLLTMTPGIEWDEDERSMEEADDWLAYALSRPLESKPGSTFNYDNGCSNLLCGVICRLEGTVVSEYAEEVLFRPLGISRFTWATSDNGMQDCGAGLSLRPRDMAKIGLLVLNEGVWQGRQVVPAAWIRESTMPHVRESDYFGYGYQWWHRSGGDKPWWEEAEARVSDSPRLVTALGAGGQFIMIIPDLEIVVVTTASDYEGGHTELSKVPLVLEEIIPALSRAD